MEALKPLLDIIFGLTGFEATGFWIGLFVLYMLVGFFIDYLMQKAGFGPYYNSVIALFATFVGLYVRYNYLRDYTLLRYEPLVTIGCILGSIAILMTVLSYLRNRFG